jgi:PKD repeat protein
LGMQSVMETKTDFITVQPAPIVTDFSADVTIGDPPLMVNFSDQTTGGVIDAWLWNFGDGNTSTTQNPTNVYQLPGNYDVTLTTFVGPQAEPHTKLAYINVNPTLALTAAFTADPTSGSNPLTVSFTNLSTGDLITGYLWDFGDGSTSTDTNPIHEYLVAGPTTFDVQLTAFSGIQTSVSNQPGLIDIGIPFISHLATTSLVNSETVEAIDIDGDGDLDFVAGSGGTNTVAWYENLDALGTFSAPRNMDASANTPIDLKGADFDGDGDQDVLALTLGDSRISWYENTDAQGNFGASNSIIQYPILTVPNVWKVGVADLDGDGDTDVISRGGWIANRDGLGGFGVENKVGFLRALFYAADVDLNGSLDLIRVFDDSQKADDTESIDWFRNSNGDGQFEYVAYIQQHYDNGNFPIGDHAVGDMDEDGYPDFVYTENLSLTVYQNKAETPVGFNRLNFGSLLVYPIPGSPASQLTELKLADMDGDGFLDVLAALKGSNRVAWRRNESGLQNLGATLFVTATALDPDGISTGDLNSDGDIDVFVADGAGNQVTWQENTLASPNWPYLGQGLAGDLGNPVLTGGGELSEGSNVNLRLTNANQNAPAVLVIGFSRIDIPILGGTLVPFPNFKQKGLLTDANGEIAWDLIWPPGLSPNTTLYFQCWVSDASGPQGLTASNGLSSASP